MRIISPVHDYYDGVTSYGHDETVIYHRVPNVVVDRVHKRDIPEIYKKLLCEEIPRDNSNFKNGYSVYFNVVTVLFCGKLYGGLGLHLTRASYAYGLADSDVKFFAYSLEQLQEFCEKFKFGMSDEILDHQKYRWWRSDSSNRSLREHLALNGDVTHLELAISTKVPVVLIEEWNNGAASVTENPRLQDVQFFRAVDSFTAFQELDMFIGGILAPENRPMVTVEDKYKIQGHGFDKWSFRKMPTK